MPWWTTGVEVVPPSDQTLVHVDLSQDQVEVLISNDSEEFPIHVGMSDKQIHKNIVEYSKEHAKDVEASLNKQRACLLMDKHGGLSKNMPTRGLPPEGLIAAMKKTPSTDFRDSLLEQTLREEQANLKILKKDAVKYAKDWEAIKEHRIKSMGAEEVETPHQRTRFTGEGEFNLGL